VEEEAAKLEANWTPVAAQLLEEMKEAIISGPVLKRPDWNRTFYVKTDWSSYAKGGALCQPECSPEAKEALRKDMEGKDGGFDKTISGFQLRPVQFISKKNSEAERSQHSSVGELATGRWAFIKWHKYLWI
jgi:RNase H-like domain found in reverse transcriptase